MYYDDNCGAWDMDGDEGERHAFYRQGQRTNVRKRCQGCGNMVRIQPHYAYCNSCADTLERGGDLYG